MVNGNTFKFVSDISKISRERNLVMDLGKERSGLHLKVSFLSDLKLLKESGSFSKLQLNKPISTTLPFWMLIPNEVSSTSRMIGKPLFFNFIKS